MAQLDEDERKDERSGWNFSNNQLIVTIVAGLLGIVAAFVGGAFKGNAIGLTPVPGVTVTARVTVPTTVTVTSRVTVTAQPSGSYANPSSSPTAQPNPQPSQPVIPVLTPQSQQGWTLAWSGTQAFGPQGVVLTSSGPHTSDGSDFTLQYVAGENQSGWSTNGLTDAFAYWTNASRPGPATIFGLVQSNGSLDSAASNQAQIGDRLMFVGGQNNSIVAYMQITGISAGNAIAKMWLWNQS
jgi:hypothetical protein